MRNGRQRGDHEDLTGHPSGVYIPMLRGRSCRNGAAVLRTRYAGGAISDSRQRPEPLANLATAWPANSSVNVDRRPAPDPQGSASVPVRFTIARCREPTEIEADVLAENAHPGGCIFVAFGHCYRPDRVYRGSYPLGVTPAGKLDGDDLSSSTPPRPARHMSMHAAVVTEFAGQLCR
jgi:hypothetical protein